MPEIENKIRNQIAKFLPSAMGQALNLYRRLPDMSTFTAAKDFKILHDARKVAIANILLLIDLAKWVDLPEKDKAVPDERLAELINAAQNEVEAFEKKGA